MAKSENRDPVVLPEVEETVEVEKRRRDRGVVRISTRVHEDVHGIDEPLDSVEVEVERVPVGRWLDGPVEQQQDGDTTIIPVVEEVPVIVKRLRLVEEVRVTRRRTTRRHQDSVTVRRSEVVVERHPPGHSDADG